MPDFVLQNGKEITFDFRKITHRQWKGIFYRGESEEETEATLARLYGITEAEINDLDYIEYQQLFETMLEVSKDPLKTSPNSRSASTSG